MQLQHRKLTVRTSQIRYFKSLSWLAADLTRNPSTLLAFSAGRQFYRELPEETPPWWKPMHLSLKTTFSEAPPFTFLCKWTQDHPSFKSYLIVLLVSDMALWKPQFIILKILLFKKQQLISSIGGLISTAFLPRQYFHVPVACRYNCSMQIHFLGRVLPKW